jgi:hypothetical protein
MSGRVQEIKAEIAAADQHLNSVLDQVGDRWETQVYAEGEAWSIQQLAVHLMIARKGHLDMATYGAQGKNLIPEDYDVNRFNRGSVRRMVETPVGTIRDNLTAAHSALIQWLDDLEDESLLDREGRYPTLTMKTVEQILRRNAAHERGHADDIAAALGIA